MSAIAANKHPVGLAHAFVDSHTFLKTSPTSRLVSETAACDLLLMVLTDFQIYNPLQPIQTHLQRLAHSAFSSDMEYTRGHDFEEGHTETVA